MDESKIDEAKTKLNQINDFISPLDPELKQKAIAILIPLYFDEHKLSKGASKQPEDMNEPASDEADLTEEQKFFSSFNHTKAADNVVMMAAWLYSQHGVYPITPEEIKAYAAKLGLTVAARVDNTMRQAKRDGKGLFRQVGKGWEPTLTGEGYFKDTYGVKKGNKPLEETN
jgi:hypothetical protein